MFGGKSKKAIPAHEVQQHLLMSLGCVEQPCYCKRMCASNQLFRISSIQSILVALALVKSLVSWLATLAIV
jgi:hypothetical protein